MKARFIVTPVFATIIACSGSDPQGDAGSSDATGGSDTGLDAGSADNGALDSGPADAGETAIQIAACTAVDQALDYNGTGADALSGSLSVFALHLFDKTALPDAVVRIHVGVETVESPTDANGCVRFEGAALAGSVDVHLLTESHGLSTRLGFDSNLHTFYRRRPEDVPPAETSTATVQGTITDLAGLGAVDATSGTFSLVTTATRDFFGARPNQAQRLFPNNDLLSNVSVLTPGRDLSDYSVVVNAEETAGLSVTAGVGRLNNQGRFTEFDYTHHNYIPLATPLAPGETRSNIDVSAGILRSEFATVTAGPMPLAEQFYRTYVVTADDVKVPIQGASSSLQISTLPPLSGPFAGGSYALYGTSFEGDNFSARVSEGHSTPNLVLPDLPSLPSDITLAGRTVTASIDGLVADRAVVFIRGVNNEFSWYAVTKNAEATLQLEIPPVAAGQTDRLNGEMSVIVYNAKLRADALRIGGFDIEAAANAVVTQTP